MATQEATVQTLTAEVRVLMIGSKQVTMTIFRQLDSIDSSAIGDVFGRVNEPVQYKDLCDTDQEYWRENGMKKESHKAQWFWVIGKREGSNDLVRSAYNTDWEDLDNFPLIILTGLR